MAKKERLRRDIAGVGPEPQRSNLQPLSSLSDFQIAKGEPDIRGWSVRTLGGNDIGRVDDLLVDADAGQVVMMDVELRASDQHLELPIRSAQLDHDAHRVMIDSSAVDRFDTTGATRSSGTTGGIGSEREIGRSSTASGRESGRGSTSSGRESERGSMGATGAGAAGAMGASSSFRRSNIETGDAGTTGGTGEHGSGILERARERAERTMQGRGSREGSENRESRESRESSESRDSFTGGSGTGSTGTPSRSASSVERNQISSEARSDSDEVVLNRRPMVEEVVRRRRPVDQDRGE